VHANKRGGYSEREKESRHMKAREKDERKSANERRKYDIFVYFINM
jgi:hypothetical protein